MVNLLRNQVVNLTGFSSPVTSQLRSVFFTGAGVGFSVGTSGMILKTVNGGASWTAQASGVTEALLSVHFPDPNIGYTVGTVGTILKTTNGGGEPFGEGLNESLQGTLRLNIHPNPCSDRILLEDPEPGQLAVYDLNGRLVRESEVTGTTTVVDVSALPDGIYLMRLVGRNIVKAGKFVKN